MTWNPHLLKMNFDPVKDLTGITMVSAGPPLLVAHPSMPFNSVGEMIAYAKANPAKLKIGGSTGGVAHVVTEMIRQSTGANITFVPYKAAGGQITTDVVGNVIQLYFDWTVTLQQLISSGRVKALGVASDKRLTAMPNVATFAESGYPGGSMCRHGKASTRLPVRPGRFSRASPPRLPSCSTCPISRVRSSPAAR